MHQIHDESWGLEGSAYRIHTNFDGYWNGTYLSWLPDEVLDLIYLKMRPRGTDRIPPEIIAVLFTEDFRHLCIVCPSCVRRITGWNSLRLLGELVGHPNLCIECLIATVPQHQK
jgi:hypothetical protein